MSDDAGPSAAEAREDLGDLLRLWRERALLTQEQLAERATLSVRTIRRLEAGATLPRSASIQLICSALGLGATDRAALVAASRSIAPGPAGETRMNQPVVPKQLPADVDGFVGRDVELSVLDRMLGAKDDAAPRPMATAVIAGTAGIGKTALAVHWAHRVAHRFPDGQLYVNLRGYHPSGAVLEPADAVRGFLDALGVPPARVPADQDAQAGLYRTLVADKRMLVVLDNARDSDHVRPLLPGGSTCMAVITTRDLLTSLVATTGARPLVLDLLPPDEARQLLSVRVGAERVAAEADAANGIVLACSGLPLALAVAAARAATCPNLPLGALADQLRNARSGLDALVGGDAVTDTRAVFSWSYRALGDEAAQLFRLLGHHYGPDIAVATAASLAGLPVARTQPLLAELCGANLLSERLPGRYGLHDLLRTYAAELARAHDGAATIDQALERALDHDLHTAHAAAGLLNPDREAIRLAAPRAGVRVEELPDQDAARAWFTAEYATLLAGVVRARDGFDRHAWQLAWTLADFVNWQGYWQDWRTIQCIAVDAARRQGDVVGRAHSHRGLAGACFHLHQLDDAFGHLRTALELYEELGDLVGQARTHFNLSRLFGSQDRHPQALHHSERALDLYVRCGHRSGQARALNSVGWDQAKLGDYRRALTHCRRALSLFREVGDRSGEATAWDSVGYVHQHLGNRDRAIACYRHALGLFRDLGNRFLQAETLSHLGDAYAADGADEAAQRAWRGALAVLEELGHPEAEQVSARIAAHLATA
jgi:tetratricopeptide (TPR) repeat protein/transcriptional regulator with XRE-family HTH domain